MLNLGVGDRDIIGYAQLSSKRCHTRHEVEPVRVQQNKMSHEKYISKSTLDGIG